MSLKCNILKKMKKHRMHGHFYHLEETIPYSLPKTLTFTCLYLNTFMLPNSLNIWVIIIKKCIWKSQQIKEYVIVYFQSHMPLKRKTVFWTSFSCRQRASLYINTCNEWELNNSWAGHVVQNGKTIKAHSFT